MEHINSIIIFLGKNIKSFFISILLRFIVFTLILTISVVAFFLAGPLFKNSVCFAMILLLILIINHLVNHKIFIKHTFSLMERYSEDSVEKNIKVKNSSDLFVDIKRKKVLRSLLSLKTILMLPAKFSFSLSFILNKYRAEGSFHQKEIKGLLLEHYKQIVIETLISLAISLPFFLISIVFTAGYGSELLVLSLILAMIFFLFIKSALITPIFYLITFRNLLQRIRS